MRMGVTPADVKRTPTVDVLKGLLAETLDPVRLPNGSR